MHELSLCQSLLRIIEKKISELGYESQKRVKNIWLEAGMLCGIDIHSLQFYFPLVAKNSAAADAQLHITIIPARAQCAACKQYVNIEAFGSCPLCTHGPLTIEQGQELIIKTMEIA